MKRVSILLFACVVTLCAAGCACKGGIDYQLIGGTNTSAADLGNSSGVALKAAQEQMKPVAPDAVPVMIGTGGVVLAPPPDQWSVMFVSPSKQLFYSVEVSHKEAEAAREMGSASKMPKSSMDAVVDYTSLKVGSDEAYEKAKAELAKTGAVPPQAMQSITLIEMPNVPNSKAGVWHVSFLKGTSREGMRTADVDAMTGEVTETTKK
jgi:hypothetical protein